MQTAVWVGVGGFFGSIARYLVAGAVSRINEVFPWGTFVVNVTGSFALGMAVAILGRGSVLHPDIRIGLTVGFIAAYTTFSTLALETYEFAETGSTSMAALNIIGSIAVGLAAVWAGLAVGRAV